MGRRREPGSHLWATRRVLAALIACGALLWLGTTAARAASTRFVATAAHGGNDNGGTNSCLSSATPCLTIQNAVNHAASGDTIQIGPGVFFESVSDPTKSLTFDGAGAGTTTSFDPSTETAVDAAATANPAFTLGDVATTFQGLRIRGGLKPDGFGGEVEPAIFVNASSGPAVTVSNSLLLQAQPPSPDVLDYTLDLKDTNALVQNSTIVGFEDGIDAHGTLGSVTVQHSVISTPTPANPGLSAQTRSALETVVPASVSDASLSGISGLFDNDTTVTVARTILRGSGPGGEISDFGHGASLAIRDSLIVSQGMRAAGLFVRSTSISESEVPTLSLTGDSVFVRSNLSASGIDVSQAATGTHVHTRNTILQTIDTSGGSGNNDIVTGSQAINWDIGYTAYTQTSGPGVPPPGSGTNINALPDFVDVSGGNLRLAPGSTLFDRGDPSVVQAGETDITGAPRSVPHACGAPARPDLGAYEAAAPACPIAAPKPVLTNFSQTHKKWRTGKALATITRHRHKHKAPRGTSFGFTLNTPAEVTMSFTRLTKGRKVKKKCVAQTKHNKHKHRCTRRRPAGALALGTAPAGHDTIAFQGPLGATRKLKPGRYTVQITATNATGEATSDKLKFTIVKS